MYNNFMITWSVNGSFLLRRFHYGLELESRIAKQNGFSSSRGY